MVGGIILAVIEGLNIGMSRMFSNMGGPEEPTMAMAAGAGEAEQQDAAEQPWWAKLLPMPAAPPPDVDFSDPKEMEAAPGFGQSATDTSKWAKRPIEPHLDAAKMFMLMRGHSTSTTAIADWRNSLLMRRNLAA